jgi:AraC-like DNA-binding protein
MLGRLRDIVRKNIKQFNGREAEHESEGFVVSFVSAANALSCALAIKNEMPAADAGLLGFRMALNGGEPIEHSNQLFGDTIRRGHYLCKLTSPAKIAIAGKIQNLVSRELLAKHKEHLHTLTLPDEDLVLALFERMEEKFQDPAFDTEDFAISLSMSSPQFYRKTMALTGMSGNNLLREFRLNKAKELLKSPALYCIPGYF